MRRSTPKFLPLLLCCVSLVASAQQPKAQHPKKTAAKPSAKPVATAPAAQPAAAPTQPVPTPTPEQGPSSPPEVAFREGQLTITARNSTLSDVLNAVKQKTGASVEMPASSSERVVGQFGPGAPRDVIAQLLNGSHFDYVLLGSPADPGALKKIVLMARAMGPEPTSAAEQQAAGQNAGADLQAVPQVQTDQPEDNGPEMPPEVAQPEEPQAEQPEQPEQPEQAQPGQPVVKTPEQLLRELQQQQQQQEQNSQPPQRER
jgi:hypothetical protein